MLKSRREEAHGDILTYMTILLVMRLLGRRVARGGDAITVGSEQGGHLSFGLAYAWLS